ncbi:MAG TPA: UDP-N-acetylmuramoyl-tripeptide--D-alanyl-D-alanine ligase [Arenibacter sp.]|nr:UDP-N-acetylmuramoyl-tripeptide--D-alanyl-D-alanine ligase [Arenibacter sp.]
MTINALHQLFLTFPHPCTDTRRITPNCIFFALRGDNFDGNAYAAEALGLGAAYAVVDDPEVAGQEGTILVQDVLTALQDLAKFHRQYCGTKVIGLTGSNGKTTTKELITAVLSKKYRTIATKGNLNNHIGVPLTLLSISPDTEIAIVEMGANHPGEIAFLCQLVMPDYGYITNFGKAHLEGFGSIEGVIKAKGELYDHLLSHNNFVFFNADDPVQKKRLASVTQKYGFGSDKESSYPIQLLDAAPFVRIQVGGITINTQLVGSYNFTNCCAAITIGNYFKVDAMDIRAALESYIPQNNRSQIIKKNGLQIILDAYNANPTSMKAALENFKDLKSDHKVVFLGDMFELGESAKAEHQEISDLVENMGFGQVFLIGSNFCNTEGSLNRYKSFDEVVEALKTTPLNNAVVLIKGSRGMALERIIDLL